MLQFVTLVHAVTRLCLFQHFSPQRRLCPGRICFCTIIFSDLAVNLQPFHPNDGVVADILAVNPFGVIADIQRFSVFILSNRHDPCDQLIAADLPVHAQHVVSVFDSETVVRAYLFHHEKIPVIPAEGRFKLGYDAFVRIQQGESPVPA